MCDSQWKVSLLSVLLCGSKSHRVSKLGVTLKTTVTFGSYLCKVQYANFEDLFQDVTDVFIQLWFQLHKSPSVVDIRFPKVDTFQIYSHGCVLARHDVRCSLTQLEVIRLGTVHLQRMTLTRTFCHLGELGLSWVEKRQFHCSCPSVEPDLLISWSN